MAKKAKVRWIHPTRPPTLVNIEANSFTGPPAAPPPPEYVMAAVKAIADACAANARALEKCAARMCGPDDNRVGLHIHDIGTTKP